MLPDSRHSAGAGWFAASFERNVWCDRPTLHSPGRYMSNDHCCDNRGYDETHRRHRGCVGGEVVTGACFSSGKQSLLYK